MKATLAGGMGRGLFRARALLLLGSPSDLSDVHGVVSPVDGDLLADVFLDFLKRVHILLISEADRPAACSGAARTPDTMYIVFRVLGKVVVDHVRPSLDVDAPAGHVRGHENGEPVLLEVRQDPESFFLFNVAGDGLRFPGVPV